MKLCLGTVQFGTQYGIQGNIQPSKQGSFEIISNALAKGICWIDTASTYGTAEELLGEYREKFPTQVKKMKIVSKLAPNAIENIPVVKWKETMIDNIRANLKRLHIQQLDAYIFHNASYIFDEDAVVALESVCQEGLAKSIGVSIYTPQEAMQALNFPQIRVIQVPYNVFDRRLDHCGFFKEAKKKQVRVFARSSLLQGLAVMKPECLPAHMRFAVPYLMSFQRICADYAITPLHAAVSYVANHSGVDFLLFGVDNKKQLEEYISFVSAPLPCGAEDDLAAVFELVPEKLVNPSLWNQQTKIAGDYNGK